jgi:adenylosuccinate lyase
MTAELMRQFIESLDIPDADKQRLLALTPAAYTGIASALCAKGH